MIPPASRWTDIIASAAKQSQNIFLLRRGYQVDACLVNRNTRVHNVSCDILYRDYLFFGEIHKQNTPGGALAGTRDYLGARRGLLVRTRDVLIRRTAFLKRTYEQGALRRTLISSDKMRPRSFSLSFLFIYLLRPPLFLSPSFPRFSVPRRVCANDGDGELRSVGPLLRCATVHDCAERDCTRTPSHVQGGCRGHQLSGATAYAMIAVLAITSTLVGALPLGDAGSGRTKAAAALQALIGMLGA